MRRISRIKIGVLIPAITLLIPAIAGCAATRTPEPRVVIHEVDRPVAVSCVPSTFTAEPPARTGMLHIAESGALIQAMAAELVQRRAYDDQAAPVIAGCRTAGQSPH